MMNETTFIVFWLDEYEYEYEAHVRNFYYHETWSVSIDKYFRTFQLIDWFMALAANFLLFRWDHVLTEVKNTGRKMHKAFESNWVLFTN